jgi:hypothetical protein
MVVKMIDSNKCGTEIPANYGDKAIRAASKGEIYVTKLRDHQGGQSRPRKVHQDSEIYIKETMWPAGAAQPRQSQQRVIPSPALRGLWHWQSAARAAGGPRLYTRAAAVIIMVPPPPRARAQVSGWHSLRLGPRPRAGQGPCTVTWPRAGLAGPNFD